MHTMQLLTRSRAEKNITATRRISIPTWISMANRKRRCHFLAPIPSTIYRASRRFPMSPDSIKYFYVLQRLRICMHIIILQFHTLLHVPSGGFFNFASSILSSLSYIFNMTYFCCNRVLNLQSRPQEICGILKRALLLKDDTHHLRDILLSYIITVVSSCFLNRDSVSNIETVKEHFSQPRLTPTDFAGDFNYPAP